MQTSKAGFPTRGAAQQALQEVVRTLLVDVGVHNLTVGEYLETWLIGKHALKPKTVALYRDMANNYERQHYRQNTPPEPLDAAEPSLH